MVRIECEDIGGRSKGYNSQDGYAAAVTKKKLPE